MTVVGAFETKNRPSELIDRAGKGEEITITRRGQVVARLVPPVAVDRRARAMEAIQALRKARKRARLEGLSIRALIEEGRR